MLLGCSYQGLFKERAEHFSDDEFTFLPKRLSPNVKGCMVDLYGRAGQLDKALEIIHVSSCHEDPVLWRTLLGSCKIIRRNLELEEVAIYEETDAAQGFQCRGSRAYDVNIFCSE